MDHTFGGKYKLGRKIGSGSFGELYIGNVYGYMHHSFFVVKSVNRDDLVDAGINIQSGEEVAIKLVYFVKIVSSCV